MRSCLCLCDSVELCDMIVTMEPLLAYAVRTMCCLISGMCASVVESLCLSVVCVIALQYLRLCISTSIHGTRPSVLTQVSVPSSLPPRPHRTLSKSVGLRRSAFPTLRRPRGLAEVPRRDFSLTWRGNNAY